jgi:hypothetical protein
MNIFPNGYKYNPNDDFYFITFMALPHDISQTLGAGLSFDTTGDLQVTQGTERSQQRVLRRLLTNPGEYLFHLAYGAGLPVQVGKMWARQTLQSLIRQQLWQENSITSQPAPDITVTPVREGVSLSLRYQEAQANQVVNLSLALES